MAHATTACVVDHHRDDAGVVERTQRGALPRAFCRSDGRCGGVAMVDVADIVSYDIRVRGPLPATRSDRSDMKRPVKRPRMWVVQ